MGYPDYSVDTEGNVYSHKFYGKWTKLKPTICKRGYYVVSLCANSKVIHKYVHQLVGLAFIPNPENKSEIDHKDRNPLNNDVSNLRWVTHGENNNNENTRKYRSQRTRGVINVKPILCYDTHGNFIKEYAGIRPAARELGINNGLINRILKGKRKTTHGYIFKYKEECNDVKC